MKRQLLLLLGVVLCACTPNPYGRGVPASYVPLLDAALEETPRADSLRALLSDTPCEEREAMAYLIAWMPRGDRDTMSLDLLREDVHYACRARSEFEWAQKLPDSIFLNEVLPYAAVDEVRDSWRADFYRRFAPRVAGCKTLREAFEAVNRSLRDEVQVDYNTLREKTNQSPAESMRQHMASCTGLSVLLVDALRAVGVPARFAGTAAWHDNRGNHSWTEVWLDGEAYFDVEHDAEHPFIVHSRRQSVRVLGTTFNVQAYSNEEVNTVTLLSGSVGLDLLDNEGRLLRTLRLHPNEQCSYDTNDGTYRLTPLDAYERQCSWEDGVYRFRDESLDHIAARLQNYYGVRIILEDESLGDIRYTGTFSLTERLDEVFSILNYDHRLHIVREGNTFRISARRR